MKKPVVPLLLLTSFGLAALAASLVLLPKPKPALAMLAPPVAILPGAHILEEPIQPLPEQSGIDPQKAALGALLFADKRLSHDNTISCASCHSLDKGGTDQLPHSVGIGGAIGAVNAPTVLNSGLNYKQFWNGRAETLEDQVNGPTHNPKEMGSDWPEIIGKLKQDPQYTASFAALYPETGIAPETVRDAIAGFERTLITPDSRFDQYLRGDSSALNAEEKQGYLHFKQDGCISCHQGANIGGNMFQKFGIMGNYFADRGAMTDADLGRYAVTGREEDKYVFRVPSLRNVALTAPYFHDGTATTLPQAVEVMAKYQLGRPLEPTELVQIVKFLNTLTGKQPGGAK
jgi:cytochrome c peroxidase